MRANTLLHDIFIAPWYVLHMLPFVHKFCWQAWSFLLHKHQCLHVKRKQNWNESILHVLRNWRIQHPPTLTLFRWYVRGNFISSWCIAVVLKCIACLSYFSTTGRAYNKKYYISKKNYSCFWYLEFTYKSSIWDKFPLITRLFK